MRSIFWTPFIEGLTNWNRLPTDVVDALSLETFKVRLDKALGNSDLAVVSLFVGGELDYMAFKGPFRL